jgi:Plasmid encoded RepA protein
MTDIENQPHQLTTLQRRLIDAAADIIETQADSPEFLHSVLCQVGLPRAQTNARTFQRSSGTAAIEIAAGQLFRRGKFVPAPMPYGAKPRLVLMHLCAEAVRTRSPEIEVGRSAREFLNRLGLDNGGHEYARFRAQMESLAACRMTLGMSIGEKDITINTQPITRFEAWMQDDNRSIGLWPGSMTLSGEFYSTLLEHAVPLDPRAIRALQHSALTLDIYAWLAHRLCRVRKAEGVRLSWGNLRQQFGQEYSSSKDFKKEFRAALLKVRAVYPDARIDDEIGGLRLYSSPSPVPKSQGVVKLPGR